MASARRTAQALHPTNLHVNKSLFPRDTIQSRLPDPEWLEHWLDKQIKFDAVWESKVVERILHNMSLLMDRSFKSVQELNRYRKEVAARAGRWLPARGLGAQRGVRHQLPAKHRAASQARAAGVPPGRWPVRLRAANGRCQRERRARRRHAVDAGCAWASGATATSSSARRMRAARPRLLRQQLAGIGPAPASSSDRRARSWPRSTSQTVVGGHAGMQHAGQAAVVRQRGLGQQRQMGERPGQRARPAATARGHARGPAVGRDQRRGRQGWRARCSGVAVHEARAPPAPGLGARRSRGCQSQQPSDRPQPGQHAQRHRASAARCARRATARRGRAAGRRAQPKTARHSAQHGVAFRAPAPAAANWVGCSSRRARCCARRSSR